MNKAKSLPASGHYPSQQSIEMNPYIDQQIIFQPQIGPQIQTNIQDPTLQQIPNLPQGPPATGHARRRSPHRSQSPLNGPPLPPPQHTNNNNNPNNNNNNSPFTAYSQSVRTSSPHRPQSVTHSPHHGSTAARSSRTNSNARSIPSHNSPQLMPVIPNQIVSAPNNNHHHAHIQPPAIMTNFNNQMMVQPPNMIQQPQMVQIMQPQQQMVPLNVSRPGSRPTSRRPSSNYGQSQQKRESLKNRTKRKESHPRKNKIGKVKFAPRKSISKQLLELRKNNDQIPRRSSARSAKSKKNDQQLITRTVPMKRNSSSKRQSSSKRNSKLLNQPRVPSHGHSQQKSQQKQQQHRQQPSPVVNMGGFTLTDAMYD